MKMHTILKKSYQTLLFILIAALMGCSHSDSTLPEKEQPPINDIIKQNSRDLAKKQAARKKAIERERKKQIVIDPVLPKYDPLDHHKVSFSMVNERLETILYLIAETVGMNIIMDSNLSSSRQIVTLNFKNVSAKTVLQELAEQYDLNYRISGNIIRISTVEERLFSLNFLDTNVEMNFNVGGDVLGGGTEENASGLAGSVTISGSSAQGTNPYDILETMIRGGGSDSDAGAASSADTAGESSSGSGSASVTASDSGSGNSGSILSSNGVMSINRLSGTLYIKDKPSVIKTVSKLISHFKQMVSRQILIEARIIEVTLSSLYQYGIDWELLQANNAATSLELSEVSWDLTNGLVIDGLKSTLTLNSVITALETFGNVKIVSNPTIRAKHGSPAIISVGDSIAYKKSVEVTVEQTDLTTSESTEVEVSTVFDGLILGVVPFIEEYGKINLLINPIKSDVDTESIDEPEVVAEGLTISLPKVGIKEISTSISVNDGDIIVLGGLISSENIKRDKGVPILSKIPILGGIFVDDYISEEKKELVLILNVRTI